MTNLEKIDSILLSQEKIIHQIWLDFRQEKDRKGPHVFPDKYKKYQQSWLDNNPDWLYVLWDDDMSNQVVKTYFPELWKVYSKYPAGVQRCDAFRYCLLYRYGGLYVDVDTKCLKSISPLFSSLKKKIAISGSSNSPFFFKLKISNFAMYSKPNQDFWKNVIGDVIKAGTWTKFVPFSLNVINSTGPGMLSRSIRKYGPDIKVMPAKYFPSRVFGSNINEGDISKEAFAVHFSDCGWRPPNIAHQEGVMIALVIIIALVILALIIYYFMR